MKLASPTRKLILRNLDPTGNGWFGAKRGTRKHKGVDYVTFPGEEIFACMSGVVRIGNVYPNDTTMKLVEIENHFENHHYRVQQMYVLPNIKDGDVVAKNQRIGFAQNISEYHESSEMKCHCHISVWKNGLLTDPEPLIFE
jgi:murein DD-endopeptidase MepM/ murein hydrolase activator NlpD